MNYFIFSHTFESFPQLITFFNIASSCSACFNLENLSIFKSSAHLSFPSIKLIIVDAIALGSEGLHTPSCKFKDCKSIEQAHSGSTHAIIGFLKNKYSKTFPVSATKSPGFKKIMKASAVVK